MVTSRDVAAAIGAAVPPGTLTRRIAVVTNVNSDRTLDVTWPSGGTVASLPQLSGNAPEVGDVVLLLGFGEAVKDFVVVGKVDASTQPSPGRGLVTYVETTSDSATSAGAAEYEVTEMRTPTATFYAGRRYRSTIHFGLQAQVANDFGTLKLKRQGAFDKNKAEGITIKNSPEPSSALNFAFEYSMPAGNYYLYVTMTMGTRQVQFRALTLAFHSVEDIGEA